MKIFTVGHSNRSIEEFLELLTASGIRTVADIRRYPSSRKFPHFNGKHLRASLEARGIEYAWFEALGGRRHGEGRKDTPNTGIDDEAFRNYADHMLTEAFQAAAGELLSLADHLPAAVMCAEKKPGLCHRLYLSDYLTARGAEVKHIEEAGMSFTHSMSPLAKITEEGSVIYPSPLFS